MRAGRERDGMDGAAGMDGPAGASPAVTAAGAGAGVLETGVDAGLPAAEVGAEEPRIEAIEDRPLREMLRIALPSVATMTSYTVMQFADSLMVSRIGEDPAYVAAQGNGGMTAWLLMSFVLGMTNVVNTFVSQNLGAGNPRAGAAYAWNGMWVCVLAWVAVLLPAAAVVERVFGLAGHDARLVELESGYARVLLLGGVVTMTGRTLAHYFYGMHRPMVVLVGVLAGNAVNLGLNWVLIYGNLGAPALGVTGAAVATVIGGVVELAVPLAVFVGPGYARRFGTLAAWRPSGRHLRDLVRVGWPGGAMFVNEMACWTYLMAVLMAAAATANGDDPVLANKAGWVGLRYMHMSFMPAVGLSIAVGAMVGKCMGMNRPDLAASRAWLGMRAAMVYMGACAVCFVVFRGWLAGLFAPAEMAAAEKAELVSAVGKVLLAAAVFQVFDAMAITIIGALRGAGDTVWPGVVNIVASWVVIVGGGHLMIWLAPGLGLLGPWISASGFIIVLAVAFVWRFAAGKWRTIRLAEGAGAAGV